MLGEHSQHTITECPQRSSNKVGLGTAILVSPLLASQRKAYSLKRESVEASLAPSALVVEGTVDNLSVLEPTSLEILM